MGKSISEMSIRKITWKKLQGLEERSETIIRLESLKETFENAKP